MFYFRYRPYSEISVKELLYNEIYFSSPEECNDPFDSKTFYVFEKNKEKWGKLIKFSADGTNAKIPDGLISRLTEYLCERCPMTFDEATNSNLFEKYSSSTPNENLLVNFIGTRIQQILKIYKPSTRYFVSFSKSNSEPLMWSHYADKHKGFCLVFRAINGSLFQSTHQKKHSVIRNTQNGLAPNMTHSIPESFPFVKIDYEEEVKPLDAFYHLPVAVSGDVKDEKESQRIREERESHYKQKSKSWKYEEEYRIMLKPPLPWLFGEHFDFSKQERLFHYQPSQLVGIIYGARMEPTEKNRLKELLKERKDWRNYLPEEKVKEFSFIEYDAILSPNQRDVIIKPTGLLSHKTIPVTDPNFKRLYQELLEGWGWERHSNGSKKMKID